MRKFFLLITLLFVIFSGISVDAFEARGGEQVDIIKDVNDDLYVGAGVVDVSAPVNGDLVVASGEVNVNAYIRDDLIIAGGNIFIKGNIGDDVRIAGGSVRISGIIEGDLIVFSGDVRIDKDAIVKGDLIVFSGRITLNGEVLGDAEIGVGQLVLNGTINGNADIQLEEFSNPAKTGSIKGNLKYKSDLAIVDLVSSTVGTSVYEKSFIKEDVKKSLIGFLTGYVLIKIIGVFLLASLIYLYFEKIFKRISDNVIKETLKSFLRGFLFVFVTPIIIILLMITVIGIPVGLLLLFTYIFIFVFLSLINVMVVTGFFVSKYKIDKLYQKLLIILGLTILFVVINGINFILGFFTLGAISLLKMESVKVVKAK